jgi:hypothetical protein
MVGAVIDTLGGLNQEGALSLYEGDALI